MPQRSQHPLVYILLIWISILTIAQLSFIPFFLTRGQPTNISNPISSPLPVQSISNPIELVNFKAQDPGLPRKPIKWDIVTKSDLIGTESANPILLMKEGHYILNLQVTLSPYTTQVSDKLQTVILKLNNIVRLIGWINKNSNSTGLLSKAMFLPAGSKVDITIEPEAMINNNLTVTYLDIIWLKKLQY